MSQSALTFVPEQQVAVSRFVEFSRAEWSRLRAATPLPLTEPQLRALVSINEPMSLDEVADIYLPLSRLLNLYVARDAKPSRRDGHVPRHRHAARAVRHRHRRQRGGGEEHGVASAAGAAVALAVASARSISSRPMGFSFRSGSWTARGLARAEGLPRKLSGAPAGAVHGRREVGPCRKSRRRSTRTSPTTSSRDETEGRPPARHPHRRRAERAADRQRPQRAPDADVRVRLLRLFHLRRRERERHRTVVHRALPRSARDGLPESFVVLPPLRRSVRGRRPSRRRAGSVADDQSRESAREHPADARARASRPAEGGDHAIRTCVTEA